jgi:serine/threonine protein kinase
MGHLFFLGVNSSTKTVSHPPNYKAEIRNLNILRSSVLNHDRIMEHLGLVIIGEIFNIFFQWADLNLEQFFDDELRPRTINRDMITPKNLLKESTWLASALEYLHTQLLDEDGEAVHCCHMDLKPDNILVMV